MSDMIKSLKASYDHWKRVKQSALDRDMTMQEVIEELIDVYL